MVTRIHPAQQQSCMRGRRGSRWKRQADWRGEQALGGVDKGIDLYSLLCYVLNITTKKTLMGFCPHRGLFLFESVLSENADRQYMQSCFVWESYITWPSNVWGSFSFMLLETG